MKKLNSKTNSALKEIQRVAQAKVDKLGMKIKIPKFFYLEVSWNMGEKYREYIGLDFSDFETFKKEDI